MFEFRSIESGNSHIFTYLLIVCVCVLLPERKDFIYSHKLHHNTNIQNIHVLTHANYLFFLFKIECKINLFELQLSAIKNQKL